MNSLNSLLLEGNLVKDPVEKRTPQDTIISNFTIAVNRSYKKDDDYVKEVYGYDLAGNIIEIVVTNLGTDTILQLPVSFSVATFVSNMENISVNINPGDTVNYTFGQKAPVLVGTFNLCGMTNLSNDMIPSNDQLCKTTTDIDNKEENKFQLAQNQPNPFTNNTEIVYWIPKSGNVNFMVYNVLGELVFLEEHKNVNNKFSKSYNFTFLNAGIYYYSIEFEGKRLVKKMIVR